MSFDKPRVLVVDDSIVQVEMTATALGEAGLQAHGVTSIFDVLATMDRIKPDIIVLDVLMPALGGDQVLELIRKHCGDGCPPVILYSSLPIEELSRRAALAQANGFVRKGRDLRPLVSAVHFTLKDR